MGVAIEPLHPCDVGERSHGWRSKEDGECASRFVMCVHQKLEKNQYTYRLLRFGALSSNRGLFTSKIYIMKGDQGSTEDG